MCDDNIQVMAYDPTHGESWTWFPESDVYGLARQLDLAALQRAVVEITAHARRFHARAG